MNLSESMKCGALEPLSRALLCQNREGDDEDGQVEVQRVAERDGKLDLEIAYTYTHTGTSLEVNDKKNGYGQMFSGSNYETFDEGDGEMLGARTFTYDDTCDEDQTTNFDHDESFSAYISGAYTYDEDSTTLASKPFKSAVAPVQSFIYDALGVEQPQPQVEKQKSLDFEELASFDIATGTGSAAEIVEKSLSDLTRIGLCRTYKGDAISGMEVTFASEDDTCDKTENEKKSAVDDEDDDVTERTSLNVTQVSFDSEYDSDSGIEVGIDDVDFMFEELALELPHDDDKISTTCSACGNEEDDTSAVLSVQGGTEEKQDEHSDTSASLVLTPDNLIEDVITDEPTREDDEGEKVDYPNKSTDIDTTNPRKSIVAEVEWNSNYKQLLKYYEAHGTSNIPRTKAKLFKLRQWTAKQRKAFSLDELTHDQIAKLDAIGFDFGNEVNTMIPRLQQQGLAVAKKSEAGAASKRLAWKKSFAKSHGLLGRSSKASLASF